MLGKRGTDMDTKETEKVSVNEEAKQTRGVEEVKPETKTKGKKAVVIGCLLGAVLVVGIAAIVILRHLHEKGYEDYIVRQTQYVVEYSEEYDYWDVLTIEYPQLEGIKGEQIDNLNQIIYDTAMDRVNYWHLEPNDKVRSFQEEYTMFCSDVACSVRYHSQYLVSLDFFEIYAPDYPVYYVNFSERALNMDLVTGEIYELSDIIQINKEFAKLWCSAAHEEYGDIVTDDEETRGIILTWFLGEDEELNALYEIRPFFSITEEKEFEIGITIEPKIEGLRGGRPNPSIYSAVLTAQELETYRTDSGFWDKYEKSESAGEVIECEELRENIWLGEDGSVWSYWEER